MNRHDLEDAEARLMKLVVSRRQLGGFDVNAEAILIMAEDLLNIVRHLRELAPRTKKAGDED